MEATIKLFEDLLTEDLAKEVHSYFLRSLDLVKRKRAKFSIEASDIDFVLRQPKATAKKIVDKCIDQAGWGHTIKDITPELLDSKTYY